MLANELKCKSLGERVRYLRSLRGWTVVELAKLTGLSANTLFNVEHGHHAPRANTIGKISVVLGISLDDLLEETTCS